MFGLCDLLEKLSKKISATIIIDDLNFQFRYSLQISLIYLVHFSFSFHFFLLFCFFLFILLIVLRRLGCSITHFVQLFISIDNFLCSYALTITIFCFIISKGFPSIEFNSFFSLIF